MRASRLLYCALMTVLALHAGSGFASSEETAGNLWFFVAVKSNNFSQDREGNLALLNYHFFSELFVRGPGLIKSATLYREGSDDLPFVYVDRGDSFYYEGGHFKTTAALDAAHPNGKYRFTIELTSGERIRTALEFSGPGGKSDIPAPIHIYFFQGGRKTAPDRINPEQALSVRWSPYSNGRSDPGGIVDDMIFVVFQNCHGERVFHTGLPFKEPHYMTYAASEAVVPAGRFEAGQTYSLFVEFPHRVDSVIVNGTPGFTAYATATYTDINVRGESKADCPEQAPPLDTGQTDRMDVEIQ